MEGMKTHIVKSTYQIRKNGEEKRQLSEEKYYKRVYYSPELHHPSKQGLNNKAYVDVNGR